MRKRRCDHLRAWGLAAGCWAVAACDTEAGKSRVVPARQDDDPRSVVDVAHTPVERQTIGNCWLYACAGWAESLHKRATGDIVDLSESYWTYMHWFIQISESRSGFKPAISTGGGVADVRRILQSYGWMHERDFIFMDTAEERAFSQSLALERVNLALGPGGALETVAAREDPLQVRSVLDEAWELGSEQRAALDAVFGPNLARTLTDGADPTGTPIHDPKELAAAYTAGRGTEVAVRSLADALLQWREVPYARWNARQVMQRMQRALHAAEPVVVSWFVDFHAMESKPESPLYGAFTLGTLEAAGGPGGQGGHMTVLEDYQARLQRETVSVVSEQEQTLTVGAGDFVQLSIQDQSSWRIEADETLLLEMSGDGDADLYAQLGQAPSTREFSCRPYVAGSKEQCRVEGPADVFVAVSGYQASNVKLVARRQATTIVEQLLPVGATLDPKDPEDRALLDAALADSTQIDLLRIKNSWGANRPDLPMVGGPDRGYHDLYMDYLDGPIAKAELCSQGFDDPACQRTQTPLSSFLLPPGY